MATTVSEITGFLDSIDLKYELPDDSDNQVITGFGTEKYTDRKGNKGVTIVIALEENGEFIKVIAPQVYSYKDGPNKSAILQTCLMACWKTKMLQYEYDDSDGEIRAVIEFPLEDARLTERQLKRILHSLAQLVDQYDPAFRAAMDKGVIDFSHAGGSGQRLTELVGALGDVSPEEMSEIVEEIKRRRGDGDGGSPPDEL